MNPKKQLQANDSVIEGQPPLRYDQAEDDTGPSRRIHILGAGSIGKLVAHSLAGIPNPPPITLLVGWKENGLVKQFREQGGKLEVRRHGVVEGRTGFDIETLTSHAHDGESPSPSFPGEEARFDRNEEQALRSPDDKERIDNLILCVKAGSAAQALSSVAHRLTAQSSILFLQNGMGFLEEIDATVFPDPSSRPRYIIGIVTHGAFEEGPFRIKHTGQGTIVLSLQPTEEKEKNSRLTNATNANAKEEEDSVSSSSTTSSWPASSRYLIRTVTRTPTLGAIGIEPIDLLERQLEKLAINAVINPLTGIYECLNGELLNNPQITRVMNMLIAEISLVIRSLPELKGAGTQASFSPSRLYARVVRVCEATAANESSMMVDVKKGRMHEARYLNGYIIRRGEALGINCVVNHAVVSMLQGRFIMVKRRLAGEMPLQRGSNHNRFRRIVG